MTHQKYPANVSSFKRNEFEFFRLFRAALVDFQKTAYGGGGVAQLSTYVNGPIVVYFFFIKTKEKKLGIVYPRCRISEAIDREQLAAFRFAIKNTTKPILNTFSYILGGTNYDVRV